MKNLILIGTLVGITGWAHATAINPSLNATAGNGVYSWCAPQTADSDALGSYPAGAFNLSFDPQPEYSAANLTPNAPAPQPHAFVPTPLPDGTLTAGLLLAGFIGLEIYRRRQISSNRKD